MKLKSISIFSLVTLSMATEALIGDTVLIDDFQFDRVDVFSRNSGKKVYYPEKFKRQDAYEQENSNVTYFDSKLPNTDLNYSSRNQENQETQEIHGSEVYWVKLKQCILRLKQDLSSCYENGTLNIKRYYRLRKKIFAIEQELEKSEPALDQVKQVKKEMQGLFNHVKEAEKNARTVCEQNQSNYCVFFSPALFTKGVIYVQKRFSRLESDVMNMEEGSASTKEYLNSFGSLVDVFAALQNIDLRYLEDSSFSESLQSEIGLTENLVNKVRTAFRRKGYDA